MGNQQHLLSFEGPLLVSSRLENSGPIALKFSKQFDLEMNCLEIHSWTTITIPSLCYEFILIVLGKPQSLYLNLPCMDYSVDQFKSVLFNTLLS